MEDIAERVIPITELRRNFGFISHKLTEKESLLITRGGKPFAILKAIPEEKKNTLESTFGAWKNTELDDDKFWREVLKKKSRREPITL